MQFLTRIEHHYQIKNDLLAGMSLLAYIYIKLYDSKSVYVYFVLLFAFFACLHREFFNCVYMFLFFIICTCSEFLPRLFFRYLSFFVYIYGSKSRSPGQTKVTRFIFELIVYRRFSKLLQTK